MSLEPAPQLDGGPQGSSGPQAATPLRVAVVDDDPRTNDLVRLVLGLRGHTVEAFTSARDALEAVVDDPPAVVVCDLSMPELAGDAFCRALADRLGPLAPPVVALSGLDAEEDVGRALDAGARHFIRKPFAPGELVAIVERAGRRPPPSPFAGPPSLPLAGADPAGSGAATSIDWLRSLGGGPGTGDAPRLPPLPAAAALAAGRVERVGPYQVLGELGRGGMGVVLRGVRVSRGEEPAGAPAGREVAIKVLRDPLATVEEQLRFRRELDLLGNLEHPGIARLLDAGVEGDAVWYAMERAPGAPLAQVIAREGALPWRRVAALGRDIARALAHVHARGIVHRDVKPGNLVVGPDGAPRLIDFGLARRPADRALTRASWVVGTPLYLAPEVLEEEAVSPACDVFGLGVTLLEALAGRHPFADRPGGVLAVALGFKHGQLPPARALAHDAPAGLEAALALATHPLAARRPTAEGLARLLDGALAAAPPGAPEAPPPA